MDSAVVEEDALYVVKVESTLKLYYYSSELLTFIEIKWVITKYIIGGIAMGTIILFGVIELNQSVGILLGIRSSNTLATENNFLRQQVSLVTHQASKLELQVNQLNECGSRLNNLFNEYNLTGDTVSSLTNAMLAAGHVDKRLKLQPLIPVAKSYRPYFLYREIHPISLKRHE